MILEGGLIFFVSVVGVLGQIPSPSAPLSNFSYISGKGNVLLAIDRTGIVNRLDNGAWVALPEPTPLVNDGDVGSAKAVSVGASPDGWHHLCTLTGQTYRFNPTSNAWEFSNSGRCLQVNAMSKNTAVEIQRPSALDSNDGDIRKYNGAGLIPTWTLVAGSNQRVFQYSKWVSIGEDGEIWTISRKGNVFRYNGASNNFDGIPILSAIALDVRNATYATVVTAGCNAWTFKSGTWTKWAISTCPVQTTSTSSNDYYLDEHGRFGSRH